MSFALMRILDLLLRPAAVIFLLLLAGGWLMQRHPRTGRSLFIAGLALFYLLSSGIGASLMIRSLEDDYRPLDPSGVKADAIVVLSGDAKYFPWHETKTVPSGDSLERLVAATILQRETRLPLLISGGRSDPSREGTCEAESMASAALALGVLRQDVRAECASTDTLRNAQEIRKVLGADKRIILVTSAYHMKRAAAMFRMQGFAVVPAPAGFAGDHQPLSPYTLIPRARNLLIADAAMHEYVGYAWNGIRGAW